MFWMRNKENKFPIGTLIWRPDYAFSLNRQARSVKKKKKKSENIKVLGMKVQYCVIYF